MMAFEVSVALVYGISEEDHSGTIMFLHLLDLSFES